MYDLPETSIKILRLKVAFQLKKPPLLRPKDSKCHKSRDANWPAKGPACWSRRLEAANYQARGSCPQDFQAVSHQILSKLKSKSECLAWKHVQLVFCDVLSCVNSTAWENGTAKLWRFIQFIFVFRSWVEMFEPIRTAEFETRLFARLCFLPICQVRVVRFYVGPSPPALRPSASSVPFWTSTARQKIGQIERHKKCQKVCHKNVRKSVRR